MAEAATADKMGGKADKADKAAELLQRISATEDYYEVLGVGRDADDAAIKLAYRKAALRLHPDKCQLPGSKEAFQKVSNAFGCLSNTDERAYYDRTGRERGSGAVGEHSVDPDEIFRQFFGEDFGQAAGGAGGVRFHTFGGSNGAFVFNMGGMPAGGGGGGGGVGAMPQLPWPCGELLGLLPPQLVAIGAMCLVFWSFAWLMRYFMYFIPVAIWAPGKMKLPLCGLIWAWLVVC